MTDDLRDRLDAIEEKFGVSVGSDSTPMFVFTDGDGYVTPDGEPYPDEGGALFSLPPEVTDNWVQTDDGAEGGT